jgi:hypothetical protein
MERVPKSEWAPQEGDLRTNFLKLGGIQSLKLALGRVIEQESGSAGPGDYRELYADSLLLVALPRVLSEALRPEMETLKLDLAQAVETHGRMRGRTFRLEFAAAHAGDDILVTSGPGWAAAFDQQGDDTDSELTLQDVDAPANAPPPAEGWQRGRWALAVLDEPDGRPTKIYPLAEPVSTAGRPSKRSEFSTNIALEEAPDFVSRRQLALQWDPRNGTSGFAVYNLGRPVITLITEGAEQLPGAQIGAGPIQLQSLGAPFAIWVTPGTEFRIGHKGPILTVLDLFGATTDPDATAQETSAVGSAGWDPEATAQE